MQRRLVRWRSPHDTGRSLLGLSSRSSEMSSNATFWVGFGQHAIEFLLVTITLSGFYFICISILVHLFPYVLLFPIFLLVIKLSPLGLHARCLLGYLLWSKLLNCGCEHYFNFRANKEEFRLRVCLPSVSRNKHYLIFNI